MNIDVTNENGYQFIDHYGVASELKQFFEKNNCPLTDEQETTIRLYWGTLKYGMIDIKNWNGKFYFEDN